MRIEDLPIDGVIPEIVASLETTNSLATGAKPGTGKTTRVPVAINRAEVIVCHSSSRVAGDSRRLWIGDQTTGVSTIRVRGISVPIGPQPYALTATGQLETVFQE